MRPHIAEAKYKALSRRGQIFGIDLGSRSIQLEENAHLDIDKNTAILCVERVLKDERLSLDWLDIDSHVHALGFENVELPYGRFGYGHAKNYSDTQVTIGNLVDSCVMTVKLLWDLHLANFSHVWAQSFLEEQLANSEEVAEIHRLSPWDVAINVEMAPGKVGMISANPHYAETNVRVIYKDSEITIDGDKNAMLFKDDRVVTLNADMYYLKTPTEMVISITRGYSGMEKIDDISEMLGEPRWSKATLDNLVGGTAYWVLKARRESGLVRVKTVKGEREL